MATKTSKPTRILVSGETVDGREVSADLIQEMADSYNPEIYAARVNCEHIDGLVPENKGGQFPAYGTVLSLAAEPLDVEISGNKETVLALNAVIEVNEDYMELNAKGQKTLWSAEFVTNFRDTKKAYLTGLAITDNPASICTEVIKLSKQPFQKPEFVSEKPDSEVKGMFKKIMEKLTTNPEKPPKTEPAKTLPKPEKEPISNLSADNGLMELLSKYMTSVESGREKASAELSEMKEQFAALKNKLETEPAHQFSRSPATGGSDNPAAGW